MMAIGNLREINLRGIEARCASVFCGKPIESGRQVICNNQLYCDFKCLVDEGERRGITGLQPGSEVYIKA